MRICSTVFVVSKDKRFLMIYNEKQKAWLPPGGFAEEEKDTTIFEAGVRETKEEVGNSIGKSLRFIGNVIFTEIALDYRTIIEPTPLIVATQTLTDGRIVENFIYLAQADNETIDENRYKATWFSYDEAKQLDTFDNVRMQLEYIHDHIDDYDFFPDESHISLQYHK